MTELDRVPWLTGAPLGDLRMRAADPEAPITRHIREMEDSVVALRREAVVAVVRQEQLESLLAPVRARTDHIELEATRALEHGEERRARQILHRELEALALRDSLKEELLAARRQTIRLLTDAVHLEERARRARRAAAAPALPANRRA